LKLIFDII